MLLSKKGFAIAIPIWIVMAVYIWFFPLHNILTMKEGMLSDYELITFTSFDNKTIVVYPIFTEYAYSKNGFYDYYKHTCNTSCLNVTISRNGSNYQELKTNVGSSYWIHPQEETSNTALIMLSKLNYHFVTDIDIDKNPSILNKYTKIILLHNEYVTKSEYNALSKKPHILYLYPNALYAEIQVNYKSKTMKLIKGHGYNNITNAFGSGTHSQGEKKLECKNASWYKLKNGIEYSCYPELDLLNNKHLLHTIQAWPIDTTLLTSNS